MSSYEHDQDLIPLRECERFNPARKSPLQLAKVTLDDLPHDGEIHRPVAVR